MNISDNIRWITNELSSWQLFRNRPYSAMIQKAYSDRVYNVPDQPGVVYNFLEDSYAGVCEGGYIITGVAGEMWPVGPGAVSKYDISEEKITDEPQKTSTVETKSVYAGIQIPADTAFTLETDYGVKTVLKGNRPGIDHGSGDYVIVFARCENGIYIPDINDSGRIVNGAIFEKLYRSAE